MHSRHPPDESWKRPINIAKSKGPVVSSAGTVHRLVTPAVKDGVTRVLIPVGPVTASGARVAAGCGDRRWLPLSRCTAKADP
jgi:hypothetical protein